MKIRNTDYVSRVNARVLALILIASVSFQAMIFFFENKENDFTVIDLIYIIGPLACSFTSFVVAKRYWPSKIFGNAYFALGIAYMLFFVGEVLYTFFRINNEVPYPSIADVFYFGYYPSLIIHLYLNIKYFKRKFDKYSKIIIIGIPLVTIATYSSLSFNQPGIDLFDFYYGLIFVVGASTTLSFGVIGVVFFRTSRLGSIWLLLVSGILLTSVADTWYYYMEIFGMYNNTHPINTMWVASYLIIIYALVMHRKVI